MGLLLAAAWLAGAAHAFPRCYDSKAPAELAPKSIGALRECQEKKRSAFVKDLKRKTKQDPPPAALEKLDAFQQKEAAAYAAAHVAEGEPEKKPAEEAAKEGDLDALKKALWQDSDDGKRGVTPAMAQKILQDLEAKQGSVSPDMKDLLEHLSADGPRLSHASVRRLKTAAQEAKKNGLELGVSEEIEKFLMEPAEQTPDDSTGPDHDANAPPSN